MSEDRAPLHVTGEVLSVKRIGAYRHVTLVAPGIADRYRPGMFVAVSACYLVGYAGLLVAPYALAVPCAILIGVGTCTFALVLTLIGLRSRTPDGTAALSGFSQSSGYLLAALGPFAVGALHDATDGWTVPLLVLLVLIVPMAWTGWGAARDAVLERSPRA